MNPSIDPNFVPSNQIVVLFDAWRNDPITEQLITYLKVDVDTMIPNAIIRDRLNLEKTQDNIAKLSVYKKLIPIIQSGEFVKVPAATIASQP